MGEFESDPVDKQKEPTSQILDRLIGDNEVASQDNKPFKSARIKAAQRNARPRSSGTNAWKNNKQISRIPDGQRVKE